MSGRALPAHLAIGRAAEDAACRFLERAGYRIVTLRQRGERPDHRLHRRARRDRAAAADRPGDAPRRAGARRPGRATAGAAIGIAAPFAPGTFLVGPLLLPGQSQNAYLFLGATLAATSVGITGRVFRDLGRLGTPAARIVLGAAVIDDVLGLVILAVVSSLVQAGSVSIGEVGGIIAKSVGFLAGSIWIGRMIAPHSSRWLARLDAGPSMLFAQRVLVHRNLSVVSLDVAATRLLAPRFRIREAALSLVPRLRLLLRFRLQ